jgi:hypothetical protein
MIFPPRPLVERTSRSRTTGLVAWTEICIGESRSAPMRSKSASFRFVSVMKLPYRNESR